MHKSPTITCQSLEKKAQGTRTALEDFLGLVKFNEQGLIPAIAQQHDTKEVLMMAWMNREALLETLSKSQVCYYSRSRQSLWRKGETSGHIQLLKSLEFDCDADTVLLQVEQTGAACHTGRRDCFFYSVENHTVTINSDPLID